MVTKQLYPVNLLDSFHNISFQLSQIIDLILRIIILEIENVFFLLQPARHSKLEKADILEMTVKHLETMQRQQIAMSAATDPQVLNKFRAGFSECAGEVGRFPGLEPPVRRRLLQHLANCLNSTTAAAEPSPTPAPAIQETSAQPAQTQLTGVQVHIVPAVDAQVTTSNGIFFSTSGNTTGLQLVPTRLPNGDIALVLPSSGTQILRQVTTPSSSPSPSSSSSTSSSPLPLLLPIPARTASAGSASSSPVAFERLTVSTSTNTPLESSCSQSSFPSPVSPSSSTNSYDMSDNSSLRPFSPPMPAPLSLVVKKNYQDSSDDERPWRPW